MTRLKVKSYRYKIYFLKPRHVLVIFLFGVVSTLAHSLKIAGVVAQHIVKLNVVDLVAGFRLETLVDEGELFLGGKHLKVVEDGAEAGHVDKPTIRSVFVLVERFHQEAAVAHFGAQTLHSSVKHLFFVLIKHVLRV